MRTEREGNGRLPWFKFFPKDWLGDRNLRHVSPAARGLWIDMLCLMAEDDRPGHLEWRGHPYSELELGLAVGITESVIRTLLAELETASVLSRDARGVIICRRMVRESLRRETNRANAQKGGNPLLGPKKARRISDSDNRLSRARTTSEAQRLRSNSPIGESGGTPPPKKKNAEHVTVVDRWQRAWSHYRLGKTIPVDQPVSEPYPYPMVGPGSKAEWAAAAEVWHMANGDLAEIQKRMVYAFTAEADWMQDNLSLRLFASKWRQLDHEWARSSANERQP